MNTDPIMHLESFSTYEYLALSNAATTEIKHYVWTKMIERTGMMNKQKGIAEQINTAIEIKKQ